MGSSTLLQLVQQAQTELGLPLSTFVLRALGTGPQDATARQMGGLATRLGQYLVRRQDWTFMRALWELTVPPPIDTVGTLTKGSTTITNIGMGEPLPETLPFPLGAGVFPRGLLPGKMVVTGNGILTATRLLTVDATHHSVTIDQPVSISGSEPISFRQDMFLFPANWDRAVPRTQWDRTMRWEMRGAETPQQSQWLRSGIVSTGPRRHWQEINGGYQIWPPPSSTDSPAVLVSEYIRNDWVTGAHGVTQKGFMADGDTCVFPDDLMTIGLEMFFFRMKGFETAHLQAAFQEILSLFIASDGGSQTLSLTRQGWPIMLSPANIQDSGYPGFGNP